METKQTNLKELGRNQKSIKGKRECPSGDARLMMAQQLCKKVKSYP